MMAAQPMTLAEIEADPVPLIRRCMEAYPGLWWGSHLARQEPVTQTGQDLRQMREEDRAETLGVQGQQQVIRAAQFLAQAPRTATVNRKRGTYAWKHAAERWHERRGTPAYVGEGAFLIAAIGMGLIAKPRGPHHLLNLSEAGWIDSNPEWRAPRRRRGQ
ncbi:hypothetical protein [Pseudoroseomonas cervicalis]|uniref:hypothetical protein n=1 Tax=Teichococcus cervicalis TaxID=204525 RepID=UPI00278AFD91|nr:hypothetical protein [Pseudoroseomonas cervicalis]MDQ1081432.1 hypothetical protein [Pseudoroseomonas cervicalis]